MMQNTKISPAITSLFMGLLLLFSLTAIVGCQSSSINETPGFTATDTANVNASDSSASQTEISIIIPESSGDEEDPDWKAFRETVEEWEAQHPEVKLIKKESAVWKFKGGYAINNALSDLFFIPSSDMSAWQQGGYLADLTKYVKTLKKSPDAEEYEWGYFDPYTSEKKIYAYPALSAVSSVVLYDQTAWEQAGGQDKPSSWADFQSMKDALAAKGYNAVLAYGQDSDSDYIQLMLNRILLESTGEEWLDELIKGSEKASFYEPEVQDALAKTIEISESGIFEDGYSSVDVETAANLFLEEKVPAILCTTSEAVQILNDIREKDEERYQQLNFTTVPGLDESSTANVTGKDMQWGLAINSADAADSKKMEACISLCEYVTGKAYCEKLAQETGLGGLCSGEASNLASTIEDPILKSFYKTIYADSGRIPSVVNYLESRTWSSLASATQMILSDGDATVEEACESAQDTYEEQYLKQKRGSYDAFDSYEDEVDAVMEARGERLIEK